nr:MULTISPECIES: hypothetical protein [Bacillus cereus group]
MQEALKDVVGPMFEAMVQGEMNHLLGLDLNSKSEKNRKIVVMDIHTLDT